MPAYIFATFDETNFNSICLHLTKKDAHLKAIIRQYGNPPFWKRKPGFETLIQIILEQQVSLAAAKAAFNKLKEKVGTITPQKIISLTESDLKLCYFSRQKIIYAKHLSTAILNKQLNLSTLAALTNEEVRVVLKKIKGIGDWTVDVYLMMALKRCDLFPLGDIALIKSMKETKGLQLSTNRQELLVMAENWRPYRTIAAFILWHGYLCKRNRNIS